MKLSQNILESFASAELKTFDLSSIQLDKKLALKSLADEIGLEWNELNSPEVMKARCAHFDIPDTTREDYSEKILDLSKTRKLIHGIRHMGGDIELPFVSLRPNFIISNPSEALDIYDKIRSEYEAFKPKYLCFWSSKKIDADLYGSIYLVEMARTIRNMSPWSQESSIFLKKTTSQFDYDWYKSGYEQLHKERPELKKKVFLNSEEVFQGSVNDGLMCEAYINGQKIGLIAAQRSHFLGHSGVYFQEIFVSKNWWRKGLGKAMQRSFVNSYAEDSDFIWGTIDASNQASLKTAESNNRKPVRYECFIKIC